MRSRFGHRVPLLLAAAMVYFCQVGTASAQDFQIIWVAIGEAEATTGSKPARVGSHLFMAADLMSLSMKNVKVARVDVAPAVTQIPTGRRLCLSSLSIKAFDPGGGSLESAPLSVSVRQDQKQKLALEHNKDDICITPSAPGEYTIRFASLLPANDGTVRGAQIFVRVSDSEAARPSAGEMSKDEAPLTRLSDWPHSSVPALRSHGPRNGALKD